MQNQTVSLNCVIHGDYKKFITDQVRTCPHCDAEAERQKEVELVEKVSFSKRISAIEVKINCDVHGALTFQVPSFLKDHEHSCPQCVENDRKEAAKPAIREAVEARIKKSGIPPNYLGQRFSGLDHTRSEKQQAITNRLVQYVRELVEKGHSDGAKNIFLSGNMGAGKTLVASILLQEIVKRSLNDGVVNECDVKLKGGLSVLFVSEAVLLNEITATWKSNNMDSQKALIKRLVKKSVLCIDDVGTVASTNTHLLDFYSTLIDERYKRRLPTIITSNLKFDELSIAIGARSADRFFEKNRVIVMKFDWQGYRSGVVGTDEIEMF